MYGKPSADPELRAIGEALGRQALHARLLGLPQKLWISVMQPKTMVQKNCLSRTVKTKNRLKTLKKFSTNSRFRTKSP